MGNRISSGTFPWSQQTRPMPATRCHHCSPSNWNEERNRRRPLDVGSAISSIGIVHTTSRDRSVRAWIRNQFNKNRRNRDREWKERLTLCHRSSECSEYCRCPAAAVFYFRSTCSSWKRTRGRCTLAAGLGHMPKWKSCQRCCLSVAASLKPNPTAHYCSESHLNWSTHSRLILQLFATAHRYEYCAICQNRKFNVKMLPWNGYWVNGNIFTCRFVHFYTPKNIQRCVRGYRQRFSLYQRRRDRHWFRCKWNWWSSLIYFQFWFHEK